MPCLAAHFFPQNFQGELFQMDLSAQAHNQLKKTLIFIGMDRSPRKNGHRASSEPQPDELMIAEFYYNYEVEIIWSIK